MTTFTAVPDQLRGHAGELAGYADQLAALGTRLPGTMGEQSLGSFAQFITAGLGNAMTSTLAAFTHAASTVDKVGTGLRHTAEEYERTDNTSASGLAGIEEGIQ